MPPVTGCRGSLPPDTQSPFRHDSLGLLQSSRGHPQRGVDRMGGQRDTTRPSDQEDAHQIGRDQTGSLDSATQALDGVVEIRTDESLQFLPRHMRVHFQSRQMYVGARGTRQHLLRAPHILVQQSAMTAVVGVSRLDQPSPRLGMTGLVPLAEMLDNRMIEIQTPHIGQALLGQDFEPALRTSNHGGVERPTAKVVDGQTSAHRHSRAQHRGEIGSGTDRFGDQTGTAQPRPARRVNEYVAAPLPPTGRMRQPHLFERPAELALRLRRHATQNKAEHVRHGQLGITENDLAIVDAALRIGFEPAGVETSVTLGVASDEHPPIGVEIDRRRQQRGPIEQQRSGPPVGGTQHRDSIRCPEVDGEDTHICHPTGYVQAGSGWNIPAPSGGMPASTGEHSGPPGIRPDTSQTRRSRPGRAPMLVPARQPALT